MRPAVCVNTRGFSVLELTVVIAMIAILVAVAAVALIPARQQAALDIAVANAERAVTDALSKARTGAQQELSIYSIEGIPTGVSVGTIRTIGTPNDVAAPETIVFQGGSGYPVLDNRRQPLAIVLRDEGDYTNAWAVLVGSSGTLERYQWIGGEGWRKRN